MAAPDVPAAKRAGLVVDLTRLAAEGDGCLTPEDRYALKTYGVCAQEQDHVFMIRHRVPGGVLLTEQARGLARLGRLYSNDWLHLTTRQDVEFHWVADRKAPEVLDKVSQLGLTNSSACGHTMRNVMASEEAGVSPDEPFDCLPDARAVSDSIIARARTLNCQLPSRINLAFGGSPRCREDALVNDGGFVSVVRDGEAGYELWGGGSLGKAPRLAVKLADFIPRRHVMAAAEAIFDLFIAHGDFDHPAKGRLKFVLERLGEDGFRAAWEQAFAAAKSRLHAEPPPVEILAEPDRVDMLRRLPAGGWRPGVRPQHTAGLATLVVEIPMGDCCGADFELLSDLADRHGDGAHHVEGVGAGGHRDPPPHLAGGESGGGETGPLGPHEEGQAIGDGGAGERIGRRVGGERGEGEAGPGQPAQGFGPGAEAGEGHRQDVAHGHPHRPPVQGVGTSGAEQHGVDPKGGGVAEEPTQVLVVVDALEHRHPPGAGEEGGEVGQRPAVGGGQRPPVDVEAAGGGQDVAFGHVDGDGGPVQLGLQPGEARRIDEDRTDPAAGGQEPADHRVPSATKNPGPPVAGSGASRRRRARASRRSR